MFLRTCAIAIAALALSAGVSSSQADHYGKYPRFPRDAFGHAAYVETGRHDDHRAARHVSCDRSNKVCFDRYGLSYHATARYLGERPANRAFKRYGEQVFLFALKRGVVCDRRTDSCSRVRWGNPVYGGGYQPWPGRDNAELGWGYPGQQEQYWPPYRWQDR